MKRASLTLAQNSNAARETYTVGGSLAFAAVLPVLLVLLSVPQLVLAYGLGGLSAVALLKGYHLVRTALDERDQSDQSASSGRRSRAQSR
jgi:hypothetical protein